VVEVAEDLPCFRCGYNVRGLAGDGQCPECAAPVGETLRRHAAEIAGGLVPLEASDLRWVGRLALGCTLVLVGGIGVLLAHVQSLLEFRIPVAMRMPIVLSPFALLVAGVWIATSREPTYAAHRRTWLRAMIRAAIVAWVLSIATMIWLLLSGSFTAIRHSLIANSVTSAVASWAFFWHLRDLGGRLERRSLARVCAWIAFVIGASCLATCIPGAGEIEVRAAAHYMLTPEPIFGNSMLLVLLPYSLKNLPRFDLAVAGFAVVALVSAIALVVIAIFQRVLRRAARVSRADAARPAVIPEAASDGKTAASFHP
jgi:hypothetical protein